MQYLIIFNYLESIKRQLTVLIRYESVKKNEKKGKMFHGLFKFQRNF